MRSATLNCLARNTWLLQRKDNQRYVSNAVQHERRVVVTGLGTICPVGINTSEAWSNIKDGKCGIVKLTGEGYEKLPCRIAGKITPDKINIETHFTKTDLKTMVPATAWALLAAQEALLQANWFPSQPSGQLSTGVAIGMGMVDLVDICKTNDSLLKGYNRVSPFFVPRILLNMAAGQVSIKYGFRGPNHSVSTACATGAHSIGDSYRFIKYGDADVMVCGGTEACISPLAIAGFCRLRALSVSFNDTPERSSRPFDRDRDGFVMGEGAGILVLEELQHAKQREATILAEILGYGLSGDASHLTSPRDDGSGAILAMTRALHDANVNPNDVGYINAHATSTPVGDVIELKAIRSLFDGLTNDFAVSSTKGAHGHLLGAAGNLETIFTILACRDGIFPPTINLENPIDENLNLVANKAQRWTSDKRRVALKNAFGFGGTNACLCVGEYRD